ncbi:hypothetical protein LguiB_027116 [Lonicera macranthoides]
MTETGITEDGEDTCVSIPRGGPIYIPNMIGPLTRVSDFESFVFHELEDLKKEICWDSIEICDEDISVDELKVITEEELVDKAFEVAFKDDTATKDSSQLPEKHSNKRKTNDRRISRTGDTRIESSERGRDDGPSNDSSNGSGSDENEDSTKNISKKRKRKRCTDRRNALEGSYIAKVKKLARIKQKQDEDKAAARLHSFDGSRKTNERATLSSEKTEKITSLKSKSSAIKTWSSSAREHVPVGYPETVLCIEVYHSKRTWVKTQEFLVLGRQYLTELRDKIYCLTDHVMKKAEQHDPSGCFLIEDIFCNDLREHSAIDYSKPICDWLRDSKKDALEKWECIMSGELQQKQKALFGSQTEQHKLPHFKAVEMHKTRFCDLRFRLGAGYLYCHQGDCKHVIVIRDMRLVNAEDVQNRAAYPVLTFQTKVRFRKCSVCKIYRAEKVTVDDKWAPENPCYFCDLCYYMLHYANKSLLYEEFSVYDYHHE